MTKAKKAIEGIVEEDTPHELMKPNGNLVLVQDVVRKIAHQAPVLEDLSEEAIKRIAQAVLAEKYKDEMSRRVKVEQIDYEKEKRLWIERASPTGSKFTRRIYQRAIATVETWCAKEKIAVLDLDAMQADEFIEYLKALGRAPYSINGIISGISGLFTWLERRHKGIINPFRGTRSRPRNIPQKKIIAPTPEEAERMIRAAKGLLRAAIAVMTDTGIRVGGLVPMTVSGDKLYTHTKGKDFSKILPERAREEIKRAGLPIGHPFEGITTEKIMFRFKYLSQTMFKRGRLRAVYSPHDLRHTYAVRLWLEKKDIYFVSKSLGHTNINTTQNYLRSLELEI